MNRFLNKGVDLILQSRVRRLAGQEMRIPRTATFQAVTAGVLAAVPGPLGIAAVPVQLVRGLASDVNTVVDLAATHRQLEALTPANVGELVAGSGRDLSKHLALSLVEAAVGHAVPALGPLWLGKRVYDRSAHLERRTLAWLEGYARAKSTEPSPGPRMVVPSPAVRASWYDVLVAVMFHVNPPTSEQLYRMEDLAKSWGLQENVHQRLSRDAPPELNLPLLATHDTEILAEEVRILLRLGSADLVEVGFLSQLSDALGWDTESFLASLFAGRKAA